MTSIVVLARLLHLMPRIQLGEQSEAQAIAAVRLFTLQYMMPHLLTRLFLFNGMGTVSSMSLHRRLPPYVEELGASGPALQGSLVYKTLSPLGEARAGGTAQDA